jgi:hypothetical protein
MANVLYPKYKQALLNKEHDMDTDVIRAALIDTGAYTYNGAHTSYATDVPAGAKIAVSGPLTLPTILDGVFDTADFVWSAVSGAVSEAIILFNDTHASKGLVAFLDSGMTGMPVTPNGGNINVTVHPSGWFAL